MSLLASCRSWGPPRRMSSWSFADCASRSSASISSADRRFYQRLALSCIVSERDATYIAGIQYSSILLAYFGEHVSLVAQKSVHVPNESQVILVPRCLTYSLPPFFDQFEDSVLDTRRVHRWALGETTNELVEELLGADLEVKRVAAVLDADVEEL